MRVGRFGWKAQHATLLTFGADAYRNEMGITNDIFATKWPSACRRTGCAICDPIPDPEDIADPATRRRGIDNFASFMRFLARSRAAHRRRGAGGRAGVPRDRMRRCHVPALPTGPSRIQSSTGRGPAVLGPAAARHRHGRRHSCRASRRPTRSARRRSGASACAGRCCTTVRPALPRTRSGGTVAKRPSPGAASSASRTPTAPRYSRFSAHSDLRAVRGNRRERTHRMRAVSGQPSSQTA